MLRFLLAVAIILCLLGLWLMRPWPVQYRDANAAYRGAVIQLAASTKCDSIAADGRFNWHSVGTDAVLERCLGVVAQTLKTPAAMADWLGEQGFKVTPPYEEGVVLPVTTMLGANWPKNGNPALRPFTGPFVRMGDRISRLLGQLSFVPFIVPAYGYQIVISYEIDGNVQVDAGLLYL